MPTSIIISYFHEIADLSEEEIREIIARVGRDDMTIALKAAEESVKDRILGSMSNKERQTLTEYMEYLGPMLLTEVEAVQRRIVDKFRPEPGPDAFV